MKTILSTVALMATMLPGCATAPNWERDFGDASRLARASQVIDPMASSRNPGPTTTDGKAVAGAMTKYAESYGYAVKEAQPPLLAIPTSGGR